MKGIYHIYLVTSSPKFKEKICSILVTFFLPAFPSAMPKPVTNDSFTQMKQFCD